MLLRSDTSHQPGEGRERGGRIGLPLARVLDQLGSSLVHRRVVLVAPTAGEEVRDADRSTAPVPTGTGTQLDSND